VGCHGSEEEASLGDIAAAQVNLDTIVGGYRLFRGGDLGQKFAGGVAMAAGALDAAFNVATAGGKKTLASGVKAGIRKLVGGASKELIEAQSKALGRASLRNAAKSGPGRIVIGEDMARARAAAQKLGAETFEGAGMEANRAWIRSKLGEEYEVYDVGPAFQRRLDRYLNGKRPDSPFYGMERMETQNYPVNKLWERSGKWQGGSPFLGE